MLTQSGARGALYRQELIGAAIELALKEDLAQGDVTTDHLPVLSARQVTAEIRVRQAAVLSGLIIAEAVFRRIDGAIVFESLRKDGDWLQSGEAVAQLSGAAASLLKAERTALNFLQHLSGIATETRHYAEALIGTRARISATRKTTPGLRVFEKQAVIDGGGLPHRFNLSDRAMLKDNHIEAAGGIREAIRQLRDKIPVDTLIEVEADRLEQVEEALVDFETGGGADIILLDNMTPEQVREAVRLVAGRADTEASGGITLDTVRDYGKTGVNAISTSRITLGAPTIDFGLDFSKG